jgi:hypothetical protein
VKAQVDGTEELLKLPGRFNVAAHQDRLAGLQSIVNPDAKPAAHAWCCRRFWR